MHISGLELTRIDGHPQRFRERFDHAEKPKSCSPYSPEFRRRMVDLARNGRDPDDLAGEFEPTVQSIRNWIAQADKKEGRREEALPGLSAAERDELSRLRRENRQLRVERDILSNQPVSRVRRV